MLATVNHRPHQADHDRLHAGRHDEGRDGVAAVRHAGGAEALDGSADDKGDAVWRERAG